MVPRPGRGGALGFGALHSGAGSAGARGIGVLITDHNVREALAICGRAYILNDGEVIASGRPNDILSNKKVREVYLGEDFRL